MTVKLHLAGEQVEAVVDTGASASVVGKCLAYKLGIWKRARKVKVRQGDGCSLGGKFVVNMTFTIMDFHSVLGRFTIDAEVLDIGNRNVILCLSWLTENAFLVHTQDRCLRNVNSGQVIRSSVRWIPERSIMEGDAIENGETLLIIDASK